MTDIIFSKIDLKNEGVIEIDPDGTDFKDKYLQYDLSSHESYPSPWAPAEFFSIVMSELSTGRDLSELDKRTLKLFDTYLKGIFLGMLEVNEEDLGNLSRETNDLLKELYPIEEGKDCEANPLKRGKITVLKYKGKVVALEYPETIFFPSAHFSNWPEEINSLEKEMVDEINNEFNDLSNSEKKLYFTFLNKIRKNSGNPPYQKAIDIILKNEDYNDDFNETEMQKMYELVKVCLVRDNKLDEISLYTYSKISISPSAPKISLKGGSIVIMDESNEIHTIKYGCKGRDGNFYIFKDKFKEIRKYGYNIKVSSDGRVKTGDNGWTNGLKYEDGKLIVSNFAGILSEKEIRLIQSDDVFVEEVVKVNGELADNPLRKVFQYMEVNGEKIGFKFRNEGNNKFSILDGEVEKDFNWRIREVDVTLGIWPPRIRKGWNIYFVYFENKNDVGVKFIANESNEFRELGNSIIPEIKKLDKIDYFIDKYPITFFDVKTNHELGSFRLKEEVIKEFNKSILRDSNLEGYVGIDFGTSASVAAFRKKSEEKSRAISFDFKMEMLFGERKKVDIKKFPYIKENESITEVPSILFVEKINVDNSFSGFEEGVILTLSNEALEIIKNIRNVDSMIKENIKWTGLENEKKLYLYLFLLFTLEKIYTEPVKKLSFYFSYPLSYGERNFDIFSSVVVEIINKLKDEIPEFEIDENRVFFVPETDAITSERLEGKRLIIDMGGGSTDIVYIRNIGESSYVDSIRIAGGNIVNLIAKYLKESKITVENIIKEGKDISVNKKTELKKNITKTFNYLISYITRQMFGILWKVSAPSQQEKVEPCKGKESDKIKNELKEILLFGNGWKLFEFINKKNIAPLSYQAFLKDLSDNIIYNPQPKVSLALNLVNDIPKNSEKYRMERSKSKSGKKVCSGVSLRIIYDDNSSENVAWNEKLPRKILDKTLKYIDLSNIANEIKCILDKEDLDDGKLRAIITNNSTQFLGDIAGKGEYGIIDSPLSILLEEILKRLI